MEGREAAARRRGFHLDHVPSGAALSTAQMQKPLTRRCPELSPETGWPGSLVSPLHHCGAGLGS